MVVMDPRLVPFYQALNIATSYLVGSGYGALEADEIAYQRILPLYRAGEHRPLILANKAIAAIEKERREEDERRSAALSALFKQFG
jgi:hypothetical protein